MESLRALLYGISAQRPTHSLVIGGEQLPLEARMGGIFLGFLCATGYFWMLGRLRASEQPAASPGLMCWLLILAMALDGGNAVLADGGLPHPYPPSTLARLASGLGAGFALGCLAIPVVARSVLGASALREPIAADLLELVAGLAVPALLGALMLVGPSPVLWPVSLMMLAGVIGAFALGNLYVLALTPLARRGDHRVTGWAVAALGGALLEIVGLDVLRTWLAALGVSWGV